VMHGQQTIQAARNGRQMPNTKRQHGMRRRSSIALCHRVCVGLQMQATHAATSKQARLQDQKKV